MGAAIERELARVKKRKKPDSALWQRPDFVLAATRQYGYAIACAAPELLRDRAFMLDVIQQYGDSFSHDMGKVEAQLMLQEIRDKDIELRKGRSKAGYAKGRKPLEAVVRKKGEALASAVSSYLIKDKAEVSYKIQQSGFALGYVAPELMNDRDFMLEAVRRNGLALWSAAPEFRCDREMVLAAVQQNGLALLYADDQLWADREIALAAARGAGYMIAWMIPDFQGDPEIALVAVRQEGAALGFVSPELRADREIVMAAVRQSEWALEHVAPALKGDREIMLVAAELYGPTIFNSMAHQLRADREIILAMIRHKKDSWLHDHHYMGVPGWQDDAELMLEVIKNDKSACQYIGYQLQEDPEFIKALVQHDPAILRYAGPELKNNPAFMLEMLRQADAAKVGGAMLRYLDHRDAPILKDREFMLAATALGYDMYTRAAPELLRDAEFMQAAIRQNENALDHAAYALREDCNFIRPLLRETGLSFVIPRVSGVWQPDKIELVAYQRQALERMAAAEETEKFFKYSRHMDATWGDPEIFLLADPAVTLEKIRAEIQPQQAVKPRASAAAMMHA